MSKLLVEHRKGRICLKTNICQTAPDLSSFDEMSRESELPRPLTLRQNLELLCTLVLESM